MRRDRGLTEAPLAENWSKDPEPDIGLRCSNVSCAHFNQHLHCYSKHLSVLWFSVVVVGLTNHVWLLTAVLNTPDLVSEIIEDGDPVLFIVLFCMAPACYSPFAK